MTEKNDILTIGGEVIGCATTEIRSAPGLY